METIRHAAAHWEGTLAAGTGTTTLKSSGLGTFPVSWPSRTAEPDGRTSPEELIAAAHASCFSMALSHGLTGNGTPPTSLDTSAAVTFAQGDAGWGISAIALTVRGVVPGITAEQFEEKAQEAKDGCPVSRALAAVPEITVTAELAA